MAVGTDNMATQLVLMVLIIDHLAAVRQCLDACDEILGVLSQSGYDVFKFSKVYMGVDVMCHSLLDLVEEGRSFCLGCFLFLFTSCRHPLHMHLQGFGSQGCKDISEVVLTVRPDAVEEEQVLQGLPKRWRRSGWCPSSPSCRWASCQCTSDGISCGLGRLGDELLWGWF